MNRIQSDVVYDVVFDFGDEDGFKKYKPQDFRDLLREFSEYKVWRVIGNGICRFAGRTQTT